MPKIVKKHPLWPQKISKSGNEGILSYGQFCHFSPILWLGGWGCPPRQSTPNFGLWSTKLVGTIQVSKKMTHIDNGGGPNSNYGEMAVFAVFAIFAKQNAKNGKSAGFSVIPIGTTSVVNVGHFFTYLDGPNKFCWSRTKIRGTLPRWALLPTHPYNVWKWQNWPYFRIPSLPDF